MNDPVLPPVTQPQPQSPSPADQTDLAAGQAGAKSNPLDVLEEILKNAQQKVGTPTVDPAQSQVKVAAAAQEKARQEQAAQQKVQDEAELKAKMAELQNLKNSPQYQNQPEDQADQPESGFQIGQLGHTKI